MSFSEECQEDSFASIKHSDLIQQERSDSPAPSCVSMKSDLSVNPPLEFKDGDPSSGHSRPTVAMISSTCCGIRFASSLATVEQNSSTGLLEAAITQITTTGLPRASFTLVLLLDSSAWRS
ncbi:hypothetical protein MHYP_G00303270 [Metynnis hypsauchen]